MPRNKAKIQNRAHTELVRLFAKTENQQRLIDSIAKYPITLCQGAAGVGKTLIALHEAYWLFDKGKISKILYVKPIVDFSEQKSLGFLPGTIDEKVAPLLYPVIDNLSVFMSDAKAKYVIDKKIIEFVPLEFLRGRSLRDTVIIGDEFQNANPHCFLTLISRIEESSKAILLGDSCQKDAGSVDGLQDAFKRLANCPYVGRVNFTSDDITRSSFLKDVIRRYSYQ